MYATGDIAGQAALATRRFSIGNSVTANQLVVKDETSARLAEILDPTANDQTEAVGVTQEAGTYTTTQGTGADSANRLVRCTYSPFQLIRARASGGTTAATALAEAANGNLLTNTAASATGVLVSDTDVGTSDFIQGYMWSLSGQNKGARRIITSHSDNVSETVTVPFDYALAVSDTFVRTPAFGNQGLELTTNWEEINILLGAGVNLPDTGHLLVWEVLLDINNQGTPTAPLVDIIFGLADHVFNSLA